MKRIIFSLLTLLMSALGAFATGNDNASLSYEIKCAGNAQQGFYLVEVTAFVSKKADVNIESVKKCAIHGVLFKGFAGEQGCTSQRAMLSPTAEQQHADFFHAFFDKDYKAYASGVGRGVRTTKVRKGWEVSATVQVAKEDLRSTMEKAGIARKLGF